MSPPQKFERHESWRYLGEEGSDCAGEEGVGKWLINITTTR